jgi:hypothetical protein
VFFVFVKINIRIVKLKSNFKNMCHDNIVHIERCGCVDTDIFCSRTSFNFLLHLSRITYQLEYHLIHQQMGRFKDTIPITSLPLYNSPFVKLFVHTIHKR